MAGSRELSESWIGVDGDLEDWESNSDEKDDDSPKPLSFTPDAQFERDIGMVRGAIDQPGDDPFSGEVLKRLFTLFYYGDLRYFRDGEWRPWDLPLASAICHGARVTIEFPANNDAFEFRANNDALMNYLLSENTDKSDQTRKQRLEKYIRLAATHNLKTVDAKFIHGENAHHLKEIKPGKAKAGMQAARAIASDLLKQVPIFGEAAANAITMDKTHFGINLALEGAGNKHPTSGKVVANNGEHGHLYMLYRPSVTDKTTNKKSKSGGFLVGIEQSAPGCKDQNGGAHGMLATHHLLSATAGEDFAKQNNLEGLGPSRYYDGIHLTITPEQLAQIIEKNKNSPLDTKQMLESTGDPGVRQLNPYPDPESQANAVTVTYQEKKMTRYQEKQAGKNKGPFDGFYQPQEESKGEEEPHRYFIKAPSSDELFAELFSCQILKGFKQFIDPLYQKSLICTNELIQLPDGTYGSIQPKQAGITPLWNYFQKQSKEKHQGYAEYSWDRFTSLMSNKNDRNALYEMLYGQTHYYPLLGQLGDINSLAVCLLYSLIIGDFSVHSDNIVYFEKDGEILFAKIDAGAGLRGIGADTHVMDPAEYNHHFLSQYKHYTKAYHLLYKQVPGLYQAVSEQAKKLVESCNEENLSAILLEALDKTSVDTFLSTEEKLEIADYMRVKEFSTVGKESAEANKSFADKLAKILLKRIDQLANLKVEDFQAKPQIQANRLTPNELVNFAFPMLQKAWQKEAEKNLFEEDSDEDEPAAAAVEEKQPLPPIEIIEPVDEESVYAMRFPLEARKESIVLMSPACDAEQSSPDTAGTTPLPQVLAKIRKLQKNKKNDTYFIPLAECQAAGGLIARHHWTLLIIQNNTGYFLDPCASVNPLSLTYSLHPLQGMLKKYGINLTKYHYLNWQGITDNVNCGRFVADMIRKAAKLIYSNITFNHITALLEKSARYPTAENLINEQAKCSTPPEIERNRPICEVRGQGHLYEALREAEEKTAEAEAQRLKEEAEAEAQRQAEEAERLAQAEAAAKAQRQAEEAAAAAKIQADAAAEAKIQADAAEAEAKRDADAADQAMARRIMIAGILFAGVGALAKFSTLLAFTLIMTPAVGLALMMGGSMITLCSCCLFNRQNQEVLGENNAQLRPQA